MQLVGPVRVLVVLVEQMLHQRPRQRHLATVLAHGAAQDPDRIVLLTARGVVPPLQRDRRELDFASADRMFPGLGGQSTQGRLQLSARGGALNSAPTTEKRKWDHRVEVDRSDF